VIRLANISAPECLHLNFAPQALKRTKARMQKSGNLLLKPHNALHETNFGAQDNKDSSL